MRDGSILIIAEAGVNHNADMQRALRMIDVAAEAGADAVKFQTFKADRLVTRYAEKAEYQKRSGDRRESQFHMIQSLELSEEMHRSLIERCKERGVMFLSSPFDSSSAELLYKLGLEIFKIPSGEITNLPYLRTVGGFGKKVLLSTGMANLEEVRAALQVLATSGTPKKDVTVLHCNTEYPTPVEDVNLLAMRTMADELGVSVGYSDHTPGIEIGVAAAALGARVLEKHFTLNRDLPGPDHAASLVPEELAAMIRAVRNVEKALGHGRKEPSKSERKNMAIARKSITALRAIRKDEVFSEKNVLPKRPGTGLTPMLWDKVIGRRAPRDFEEDEQIVLEGDTQRPQRREQ